MCERQRMRERTRERETERERKREREKKGREMFWRKQQGVYPQGCHDLWQRDPVGNTHS